MKSNGRTVIVLLILTILAAVFPLLFLRGAEFVGSDDMGSEMVLEVTDGEYEPWVDPIIETIIGGELPKEMETLFFCIQTGIGVGVLGFCFGYLAAKKKYGGNT